MKVQELPCWRALLRAQRFVFSVHDEASGVMSWLYFLSATSYEQGRGEDVAKSVNRVSKKSGLSPGALVHVGEKKEERARISVIDYNEGEVEERQLERVEDSFAYRDKDTVTWLNVDGLHQVDVIEKIGGHYGLHPLVMEDILNTRQRPKTDEHETYIVIILRMLTYVEETARIDDEQVSLVLGSNFVLSFQESEGDIFDTVRDRIRNGKGRIRRMGADYLAYTLLDAVVDEYFPILERLGERMEALEQELITEPTVATLHEIYRLKRDLLALRKSVWPLREVTDRLERKEVPLIKPETAVFLRDVYDHTIQVIDTVEVHRELVSGMLDTYLSSLSNRMNEVMKVLTIIATIFIPVTFIAGVYGMNFANMPELQNPWGYYLALGIMASLALTMVAFFRRRKWL